MNIGKNMNGCNAGMLKNKLFGWIALLGCLLIVGLAPSHAAESANAAYDQKLVQLRQSLNNLEARASRDQVNLRRSERRFNVLKKSLRGLRATARSELRSTEKTLGKVQQRSNQIQRDIDLYADRILEVERDSRRAQARIQGQNVIIQELNRTQHNKLLERNESRIIAYQVEMSKVESEANLVKKELERARFDLLRARSKSQSIQVDDQPELVVLRRKMDALSAAAIKSKAKAGKANEALRVAIDAKPTEVVAAKKSISAPVKRSVALKPKPKTQTPRRVQPQVKPIAVIPAPKPKKVKQKPIPIDTTPAYVFVISGDDESIEQYLELKDWVESYGAVYIQGRWDGLYPSKKGRAKAGTKLFLAQIETEFKKIPKKSNVILIGHGQGGGAAISAATQVAKKLGRRIDYLVALDPLGQGNLRANIVYQVKGDGCIAPDGGTLSNKAYLNCLAESSKRVITSNVKNFYNRWQKESTGLGDVARIIEVEDVAGRAVASRSSTGKFSIASAGTKTDQKRVYYGGNEDAHLELLEDVSAILPNLLVRYIR